MVPSLRKTCEREALGCPNVVLRRSDMDFVAGGDSGIGNGAPVRYEEVGLIHDVQDSLSACHFWPPEKNTLPEMGRNAGCARKSSKVFATSLANGNRELPL